jgi:tetratricopeptide (TPR) repeat protein
VNNSLEQISRTARAAARARDWYRVKACAKEILRRRRDDAEGHFLVGLAENAANRPQQAARAFSRAIAADGDRYDAGVELAAHHMRQHDYNAAAALLDRYESLLGNSPRYLDMAATIYTNIGLPDKGWPLYRRANELQPGVDSLRASLAACSVYVGKIDEAREIYRELLEKNPRHQRNHYELSRLARATDSAHVEQMTDVLHASDRDPAKNIYLYYAIGKELEDLERWDEAFRYYTLAGDAAASVARYDVETDIRTIDKVIQVCNKEWLSGGADPGERATSAPCPIFVVGLPRTGTTLTERILSCHSAIGSVGETYFMQRTISNESGGGSGEGMSPAIIDEAARKEVQRITAGYLESVAYKLGDDPLFVEKFPENFLYLGFIAKAFPGSPLICLDRNPMDACFALYKQSFFRYAYTQEDLARYYVAHRRLREHWHGLLGDRMLTLDYENLVLDQEGETRRLLAGVGVAFEDSCLNFEHNDRASNTASTVQIREKMHSRSVGRWRKFERQLRPLRAHLEAAGIDVG